MFDRKKRYLLIILLCCIISVYSYADDDPWADEVVSYFGINQNVGFTNPHDVLGAPLGFGVSLPSMSGIYSIGTPGAPQESFIIVKFNTPVKDDPHNPMGLDCIIYSNAFWIGGDMHRKFIEPGLIEISKDVNKNGLADDVWYVIPGSRNLNRIVFPQGLTNNTPPFAGNVITTTNQEVVWGYADTNPTMPPYKDNYLRPDNPKTVGIDIGSGGGDAFDIAWAVDESGTPANLDEFDFIRISTIPNILDPVYGFYTTEVMAFADVAPDIDTDGDGVLDEYETQVSGTDPNRPESTVLPLEIPGIWGGSPAGMELGTACNPEDYICITLVSSGIRTGERPYNCSVDLQSVPDPSTVGVNGLVKGGLFIQLSSSVNDFQNAQIAWAKMRVRYNAEQIHGMDEAEINVYRWNGTEWVNSDVNVIDRDLVNNKIIFQTRYPGVFAIFSLAGEGDINPGQGHIHLTANPSQTKVVGYGDVVRVTGDEIRDVENNPVSDGKLFTINTFLLDILNMDEDVIIDGLQVAVKDGKLEINVEAGTVAGKGKLWVQSIDNTIHGEIFIDILPGPPAYIANLWNMGEGGQYFSFISDEFQDIYGNPLQTGVVTVDIAGGTIVTSD
ncbi:MAG: thrombospondin type 3 repeat-containing protein, partial [Candidatus Hydrogenedens sp.]